VFLIKILKIRVIEVILASVLVTVLISMYVENTNYAYYNEVFIYKNSKFLSDTSHRLIILTVTGDKNYLSKEIKEIYKDLNLIHLLVLSGSNLVIFSMFMSLISRRNRLSYFVVLFLSLLVYFCYILYLHPVARAFIFILIAEFIILYGYKYSGIIVIILKLLPSLIMYIYLDFSNSFALSLLFSLLIVIYNTITSFQSYFSKLFSTFILFPLYMSVASLPIQLYFFSSYNLITSLTSNLLVATFYDIVVMTSYIGYFVGFIEPLSQYLLPLCGYILDFFYKYILYVHYLNRIYN
jgi:predicted membrane metal-binding protein